MEVELVVVTGVCGGAQLRDGGRIGGATRGIEWEEENQTRIEEGTYVIFYLILLYNYTPKISCYTKKFINILLLY